MFNTNLDNRTPASDLQEVADVGSQCQRIVQCGADTLHTPYKAGLSGNASSGTAYVNMSSISFGTILYVVSGSNRCFLRYKSNGIWGDWAELLKYMDLEAINPTDKILQTSNTKYPRVTVFTDSQGGLFVRCYTSGNNYVELAVTSVGAYANKCVNGTVSSTTKFATFNWRLIWVLQRWHNIST